MGYLIGFHSAGLHQYPVETVIEKVSNAGYDCVELNAETLPWAQPHVTPKLPDFNRRQIRRKVKETGITISSISAHIGLVEAEENKRSENLNYALGCLDLAGDLEIPVAHLLSGSLAESVSRQEAFKWMADEVAQCIKHGESLGVKVAFEPVATHLICDTESMLELIDALQPLELFVNFDPSHLAVHDDDISSAIRSLGQRIVHVHIKDAKGTPSDYQFPPLGQGVIDFKGFMAGLKEVDYNGVLSIEYEANAFGYEQTEEEIVEGSLQFVKQLLVT